MPRKTGKLKGNKTFLLVVEGPTEKIYFSDVKTNEHMIKTKSGFRLQVFILP